MRGFKSLKLAIIYYISAMMPTLFFLIFSLNKFKLYASNWCIPILVIILILVWISISFLLNVCIKKSIKKEKIGVSFDNTKLKQINEGIIQVVFTFASPSFLNLFTDNIYIYIGAIILFHITMFYLYYNSTTYLPNVTLFLKNFHAYQNNDGQILFSKDKNIRNNTEKIDAFALSDFICIELKESN